VAYIDPGNYSTDVAAGATYRFKLLFIVLMSNIFAIFLQSLCIKLGSVSGLNLAEACKEFLPRWLNIFLYIMAEAAVSVHPSIGAWCLTRIDHCHRYRRSHWNGYCNQPSYTADSFSCWLCFIHRRCAIYLALLQSQWIYERSSSIRTLRYCLGGRCSCLFLYSAESNQGYFNWRSISRILTIFCHRSISRVSLLSATI